MAIDVFAHIALKDTGDFVSQIVDEMKARKNQISEVVLSKIQYYRELIKLLWEWDTPVRKESRKEICKSLISAWIITEKVGNILSNDTASFSELIKLFEDTNQSKEI